MKDDVEDVADDELEGEGDERGPDAAPEGLAVGEHGADEDDGFRAQLADATRLG